MQPDRTGRRSTSADLVAVVVLAVVGTAATFVPGLAETPLRVVLSFPLLFLLPGYALVSVVFPGNRQAAAATDDGEESRWDYQWPLADEPDGIERFVIAFGLSVVIVALTGIGLNETEFGVQLAPVLNVVGTFTVVAAVVAALRRRRLSPEDRFVPFANLDVDRVDVRAAVVPSTAGETVLTVLLALGVVLAGVGVFNAATASEPTEATEFFLLTETEDGELVADNYPETWSVNERQELVVGISNKADTETAYTVVVKLQRLSSPESASPVLSETELDRMEVTVGPGERRFRTHAVSTDTVGDDLRLTYLLYRGEPPADPSIETAHREVHLIVDITA